RRNQGVGAVNRYIADRLRFVRRRPNDVSLPRSTPTRDSATIIGPLGAAMSATRRGTFQEVRYGARRRIRQHPLLSRRVASGGRGYPSETHVRRGHRVVHGDKELAEKLGRNDLCP